MHSQAFEEGAWKNVCLPNLKVHQAGDFGWATCWFQAEFILKGNDQKFEFTSQGTIVLHRTAGVWKIVAEHFSPISNVERIKPID
jgi:ketosteroid isomerase-like protein